MKKIAFLFVSVLLLAGCSVFTYSSVDSNKIVDDVLANDMSLYNHNYTGYKLYIPRGLKVNAKNDYNLIITDKEYDYYLYIDTVSYYYKKQFTVKSYDNLIISRSLSFNNKSGYLYVYKKNNKLFIEYMYNYAKIEGYVEESDLNQSLENMSYILNSIKYSDSIIEKQIKNSEYSSKEQTVDIFKSKREDEDFLSSEDDEYEESIDFSEE